jgi:hypothetical protein
MLAFTSGTRNLLAVLQVFSEERAKHGFRDLQPSPQGELRQLMSDSIILEAIGKAESVVGKHDGDFPNLQVEKLEFSAWEYLVESVHEGSNISAWWKRIATMDCAYNHRLDRRPGRSYLSSPRPASLSTIS